MRHVHSFLPRFPGLRVCLHVLTGSIGIFGVSCSANAGDVSYRPTLTLEMSLPAIYNNNFGLSRTDRVDGFNATPSAQLTLKGNFSKNLSYTAFSSVEVDRYDKDNTSYASDVPKASFGLTYDLHGWKFGASYTANWIFVPNFGTFDARYDDYVVMVTAPTIALGSLGTLTPVLAYRERQSTDRVSSNHSPLFRLSWSKDLEGWAKGWKASAELGVRYLEYDQGRAVTARDWRVSESFALARDLAKVLPWNSVWSTPSAKAIFSNANMITGSGALH
jgi:hypothetical protein